MRFAVSWSSSAARRLISQVRASSTFLSSPSIQRISAT
jgi:hypothetical protein